MSEEEIYFWMKVFCNKNQSLIYEERKISLFMVFSYLLDLKRENQKLKETINEYEDVEDLTLMFMYCNEKAKDKIKELQERINKAIEYIKIYRSYQKIDNKDYLKGRDEIGCLDICQVDELLDILKEVE